jgi:hypothetical protein
MRDNFHGNDRTPDDRPARPLVVWGAGMAGQIAARDAGRVDAFVDSDFSKWNTHVNGIPVWAPEDLVRKGHPRPFVIVCSLHHEEIAARLSELGFTPTADYQVGLQRSSGPAVSRADVFEQIYRSNAWGCQESRSGTGSSLEATRDIRSAIRTLVQDLSIRSILDAPCGDLAWMRTLLDAFDDYTGVDIVPALVERNQQTYGGRSVRFQRADLVHDALPPADLAICRDCLVHLPVADGMAALGNFQASGAHYLLVTTFTGPRIPFDGPVGAWRPLNLQAAPFNLPPPVVLLNEGCTDDQGEFRDKSLGLWDLCVSDVRRTLAGFSRPSGLP